MAMVYGYPESDVVSLFEKLPCRDKQIQLLLSLFGPRDQIAAPSLFIYGHTATGKTDVVKSIMNTLKLQHVYVNCVECYNQRLLYEHVLNTLSGVTPSPGNDYKVYTRCDNTNDFVLHLKRLIEEKHLSQETIYIVLDKAERLRDADSHMLPVLLRLQELADANICVIQISEIVWEKFRCGTGCLEPFQIRFPDYSKDELLEILAIDCPDGYPLPFYMSYLNLLLSVFISACHDLKELRHLASLNFLKYVEPIERGEATIDESRKLWRAIEPHLKKALHTVYLREVSSVQWEKLQQSLDSDAKIKGLSSRIHLELPYYSKFMLIAAYLASYNPAKSDRRFFTKRDDKMSKRMNLMKKKAERTNNQLLGPKAFPLDRMMAIFYSIIEEKVAPTGYFYSQISTLVTLQLLGQIGGDDQLDAPRYKCLVSLDFIRSISRTVDFEIMRYLYDFA
ncbi:origin recognition complex subunit 5-like [Tubulanus polymorphus]|uniref:origin recognition complex subunit 5-like n=1 Tax=Tubulanus polymorphus TaxID=672921 RepID=UPI003DA5E85F